MGRILIIDDEAPFRQMLCEMLTKEGYDVEEAENGVAGVDKCYASPFDIAIVDLFMPEKEGIEVIREFVREFPELKIIAITGGGFTGKHNLLPMAEDLGAHRTLHKPFRMSVIRAYVAELLDMTTA